jgi:dipeptidyl aminopeptidase/acylaminoacyl peptidase
VQASRCAFRGLKPALGGASAAVILALSLAPAALAAQPGSDIYLVTRSGAGWSAPLNVTARPGYDNQPSFTPDGRSILFTSVREDGQADVYCYDLAERRTVRLTSTPESEYSPTVMPGGATFSVVRVERDSTQRLWRFDLDGTTPALVLERVQPVGYHAWVDEHNVALFVLGEPATLQVASTRSGRADTIAGDIGRSIHPVPGRYAVSFVHRIEDGAWISVLDLDTGRVTRVAQPLEGNEFYAWTPDGDLVMGQGAKLYRHAPAAWEEIADFGPEGLEGISRLAVSPDGSMLALVAEDGM